MTLLQKCLDALLLLTRGGTSSPRRYEQVCIDAVRARLSPEAQLVMGRQLSRLDLIQRTPDARFVRFLEIRKKRRHDWREEELFQLRIDNVAFARITLCAPGVDKMLSIKADIAVYARRFFSIQFHRAPHVLSRGTDVLCVEMLLDPMLPGPAETAPMRLGEVTHGIGQVLRANRASELRRPLSISDRETLVRAIGSRLPDDYADLVTATEGVTLGEWRINGLRETWRQMDAKRIFLVLAESQRAGWVGPVLGDESGNLFWLRPESDLATQVGRSLLSFVLATHSETTV